MCATRQRSSNEGLGIHKEARANCVAQRPAWQGFAVGAKSHRCSAQAPRGEGERAADLSRTETRDGERVKAPGPSSSPHPQRMRRARRSACSGRSSALPSSHLSFSARCPQSIPSRPSELSNLLPATVGTPAPAQLQLPVNHSEAFPRQQAGRHNASVKLFCPNQVLCSRPRKATRLSISMQLLHRPSCHAPVPWMN